jgi:hypothetical protein
LSRYEEEITCVKNIPRMGYEISKNNNDNGKVLRILSD